MKPDLRDRFAIQFAAALAQKEQHSLEFIAARAYDLAEAMLVERERRIELELQTSMAVDPAEQETRLLDEPAPLSEQLDIDPRWLEPEIDPAWDQEKWIVAPTGQTNPSRSTDETGPGLARTRFEDTETKRRVGSA